MKVTLITLLILLLSLLAFGVRLALWTGAFYLVWQWFGVVLLHGAPMDFTESFRIIFTLGVIEVVLSFIKGIGKGLKKASQEQ